MPDTGAARIATYARCQIDAALSQTANFDLGFRMLGVIVAIAEPEGYLRPWVDHCLTAAPPGNDLPAYRILCLSGPAFLDGHPDFALFTTLTDLQLEQALATVGLMGRLTRSPLVWDLFDPARRFGLRLQVARDAIPDWEATAPIAGFLAAIARCEGHALIHAASLALGDHGCLIVGEGGRGKSGTTLGGVLHGLQTAGDDYVFISAAAPYRVQPAYRTMKQDDAGLRRCGLDPHGPGFGPPNWQGKRVFPIDALRPDAVSDGFAIGAILVPCLTGGPVTTIHPVTQSEAFTAVMPSSLGQVSGDRAARFAETAALIRHLPCRRLDLGTDPAEVTAAIRTYLEAGCP